MKKILLFLTPVRGILFLTLVACGPAPSSDSRELIKTRQAVEYLVFDIDPGRVEQFIALDHEIWARHLESYFQTSVAQRLQTWRSDAAYLPELPGEWKSVPQEKRLVNLIALLELKTIASQASITRAINGIRCWTYR